jgi:lipopolysaccharide/colanic/teichoic acid biosynthesis glycosyltransferase
LEVSFQRRHTILAQLTLAILDGACFSAAYAFTTYETRPAGVSYLGHAIADAPLFVAMLLAWYLVAYRQRLFITRRAEPYVRQLFNTARVLLSWLILSVFLAAMLSPDGIDRPALIAFASTSILLVLMGRSLFRFSVWDLRRKGYNTHRLLVIGANGCTERLVNTIRSNEQFGWRIEGFLDDDPSTRAYLERQGVPYLGKVSELDGLLVQRVIDGVYVNLSLRTAYATVKRIINLCEGVGVPVRMVADLFPLRVGWTDVRRVAGVPVISLVSRPSTVLRTGLKRATEWLVASVLLVLLSPVFAIIAVAIWLTSGSPVFVKQQRLSRDRQPFPMLAFRTGTGGAETPLAGATPLGLFLHRYGLDELPQLVNVWRGEMALFGARPLQPSNRYPCRGCPRCWPEQEPGLVRLWNQVDQPIPESAPVHAHAAASRKDPAAGREVDLLAPDSGLEGTG